METIENKPSIGFWIISLFLLLWGLGGASIYVAYVIETPAEFAASAEDAAHAEGYAEYVANIPAWAIGAGVIAAMARLFGAIGLLARRAWALPLYVIALIFFSIALFRAFVLADVASVMSGRHIVIEVAFFGLSIFAVWFSQRNVSARILN